MCPLHDAEKMLGLAAVEIFLGQHGDGVGSDLDGATRLAIIIDRHLGMNGVLNAWPMILDERLIDTVRRVDSPLLTRIELVLQERSPARRPSSNPIGSRSNAFGLT